MNHWRFSRLTTLVDKIQTCENQKQDPYGVCISEYLRKADLLPEFGDSHLYSLVYLTCLATPHLT
ncbi:MAG: hypothetical protein H6Q21_1727 [Bacteroidetes bacterium]|nr:hypothetical protein [Bacteroidota bacterium]